MKMLLFIVSFVLSLPNLVVGLVVLIWQHTFSTRELFQIVIDFLFSVTWGVPIAALVIIIMLLTGCITETRPYAAAVALALNITALVLVLLRIGPPSDFFEGVFFLPVLLALIGFAWITYGHFARKAMVEPSS